MKEIRFDNKVVIVTGSGSGLGRSYAKALAKRGAKVLINDLGGALDGSGSSGNVSFNVAKEIIEQGGEAIADNSDVTDKTSVNKMVENVLSVWGRVDILINNAGILRDKSFSKLSIEDFKAVVDVHLNGSMICSKAIWDHMKEQKNGRIVMTTSSSGLYGNFGQSNYGSAKMAVIGLMNVLAIEGEKYGIVVNAISPTASTRMTKNILSSEVLNLLDIESVTAGLLYLASDLSKTRTILAAGAGGYAVSQILETEGIYLSPDKQTPENIHENFNKIIDTKSAKYMSQGWMQTMKFVKKAADHFKISI